MRLKDKSESNIDGVLDHTMVNLDNKMQKYEINGIWIMNGNE